MPKCQQKQWPFRQVPPHIQRRGFRFDWPDYRECREWRVILQPCYPELPMDQDLQDIDFEDDESEEDDEDDDIDFDWDDDDLDDIELEDIEEEEEEEPKKKKNNSKKRR